MIFSHQVRKTPDAVQVLLSGEIDLAVKKELHDVLHDVVAASPTVTEVDLREVTFLDCTGIGELVGAYLDARRRGQILIVTRPQAFVREVLDLVNTLTLLTSRPAALVGGDVQTRAPSPCP
ncbi:STAS domain-containing protein [Phytohabitans houttuyneae]|uniref:STAS domain-containing protein n=1 Tax=Phytohabitans houttuyneae TaxID=1076126 RepID=A0A6V8KMK4_9ACTN|nr:STAS domain-containing protein [Phytohabitans houttuyneae]GFJ85094.1 hypothetical protein Phou_092740 [Phytohabitans houttuyneae]